MAYEGLEDLFHNVACLLSDLAWQLRRREGPHPGQLCWDQTIIWAIDPPIWLRLPQTAFRLFIL